MSLPKGIVHLDEAHKTVAIDLLSTGQEDVVHIGHQDHLIPLCSAREHLSEGLRLELQQVE